METVVIGASGYAGGELLRLIDSHPKLNFKSAIAHSKANTAIALEHPFLIGKYDWLTLMNGANDLVFAIGGVPCRFSNDDPSNPSKVAAIAVNRYQIPFLEFVQPGEPGRFCFIVDKGQSEIEEPRVEFLGYGPSGELACRWISNSIRVLREVDAELPSPVEVSKPSIMPKQDQHSTQIKKSLS